MLLYVQYPREHVLTWVTSLLLGLSANLVIMKTLRIHLEYRSLCLTNPAKNLIRKMDTTQYMALRRILKAKRFTSTNAKSLSLKYKRLTLHPGSLPRLYQILNIIYKFISSTCGNISNNHHNK